MADARSVSRLLFRVAAPLGALFLFPRVAGVNVYAGFILQFYFFIGAVGLFTSPIEHMLIRLRHRRTYFMHFSQLLWAYIAISSATCAVAWIAYGVFHGSDTPASAYGLQTLLVAFVAVSFQTGYFLKFYKRDWYYLYSEALGYGLVAVLSVLWTAAFEMNLFNFTIINAVAYTVLTSIRLWQLHGEGAIHRLRRRRMMPTLDLAYRGTTLPSLIGAFIKRADAFYMPALAAPATSILVYRLVRNIITVVLLFGNITAQDVWMGESAATRPVKQLNYIVLSGLVLLAIIVAAGVYSIWLGIPYPVGYGDAFFIVIATVAAAYLSLSAVEINRVFQVGRYDIILVGSLLALAGFVTLGAVGIGAHITNLNFLLVLCFLPQLLNGIYIKVRMHGRE